MPTEIYCPFVGKLLFFRRSCFVIEVGEGICSFGVMCYSCLCRGQVRQKKSGGYRIILREFERVLLLSKIEIPESGLNQFIQKANVGP